MNSSLSSIVRGVAVKRLVAVEALPSESNQHEFNGVKALQEIFGADRARFEARFVYFGSDDQDVVRASAFVTWYDAREKHPTRSEYRLYFPRTAASERLREGDIAYILRLAGGGVLIAFAADGTTSERQLAWLFDLETPDRGLFVKQVSRVDVSFAAREVLDQLGIETPPPLPEEESYLEVLLDRFGGVFPSTAEFSQFARGVTRMCHRWRILTARSWPGSNAKRRCSGSSSAILSCSACGKASMRMSMGSSLSR